MRLMLAACGFLCGTLFLVSGANFAQDKEKDKKEVVLKGKITCNKCELKKTDDCQTVIVVKDAKTKKDVVYIFDKDSDTKYHDDICSGGKKGTVTGTVKDVDKKKIVTVKKLAYD